MRLPLPIHSYRRVVPANSARVVNMMAEQMPPEAKAPVSLMGTPGIRNFSAPNKGIGRGLHSRAGRLYALCGDTYCGISTTTGEVTPLGHVYGGHRAYFADNGDQTVIVSDGIGYVESSFKISLITDPVFKTYSVGPCAFVDDYIAFIDVGTDTWFVSNLGDAVTFDALNFAVAGGAPDKLVTIIVDHKLPVLIGSESCERWYNTRGGDFPYDQAPGGFTETGCIGPRAAIKANNGVYFIANDLTVRRLSGNTAVRVSQHGVEEAFKSYAFPQDVEALTYTHEGHVVIVWNFISDGATWCLDATTGEFHERNSYANQVWRGCDAILLNGVTYVQDRRTGAVGIMDTNCPTEWGDFVRREWAYGSAYKNNLLLFHSQLDTVMQVGMADANGQGSDPQLQLQWSDDGGQKWHPGVSNSVGKRGHLRTIVSSDRLGSARDRIYRRVISDPVLVRVYDTNLTYTAGTA